MEGPHAEPLYLYRGEGQVRGLASQQRPMSPRSAIGAGLSQDGPASVVLGKGPSVVRELGYGPHGRPTHRPLTWNTGAEDSASSSRDRLRALRP